MCLERGHHVEAAVEVPRYLAVQLLLQESKRTETRIANRWLEKYGKDHIGEESRVIESLNISEMMQTEDWPGQSPMPA